MFDSQSKIVTPIHLVLPLCVGLCLVLVLSACSKPRHTVEEIPRNPALEGVFRAADGGILALRPPTDGLTVLFFYSRECPISNFYLPVVNEFVARYGTERIRWAGVCVDPDITQENQRKHSQDYRITFPVIADSSGELAASVGAKFTPEVVVFDAGGRQIYRGRIDDHYAARGVKATKPENHDLDNAVKAGLEGKVPAVRETQAIGCPMPEVDPSKKTKVTYTEHIAPLIYRSCLECHRPGSIAPFSLETYDQARRRADDLADVTASRFMPPSRLDPKFGQRVQHDISLSDAEITLFAKWAEQDAVEGDPKLMPEKPEFLEGWKLGKPDVILEMPEAFTVPSTGSDIYRCFVIPTDFGKDKFVSAVEYLPGSPTAIHHILSYVDTSGEARIRDLSDPQPGYACFGSAGAPVSGELGAAGPGTSSDQLPSGIARVLPAKADIVLQIHYNPTGKPETDRTRIGLHFARNLVESIYLWFPVQNFSFRIPAGAATHEVSASRIIPFDMIALTVMPHMHLLGKEMEVWIEKPDGERVDLLRVRPWDFNWQRSYTLLKPVNIPAGSRVVARARYDNSSHNPVNPHRGRPEDVLYGEQTTDEMCVAMIGAIRPGVEATAEASKSAFVTLWNLDNKKEWVVWTAPDAESAEIEQAQDGYRVTMSRDAQKIDLWKVQVKHRATFKKGAIYNVSVSVKADAPRKIAWGVMQSYAPFNHLSEIEVVDLTDEWQSLLLSVKADRDEPNAQIVVAAGASDVSFEIGHLSITTQSPSELQHAAPEPSEPPVEAFKNAP